MGNPRQRNYHSVRAIKLSGYPYPISDLRHASFPLDVSSRESIIEAKTLIEQKEGKLHILVNK
jgi:NAD(P)-dependent dehydrogenase (short-subunit alcohol dehydrogenase family)